MVKFSFNRYNIYNSVAINMSICYLVITEKELGAYFIDTGDLVSLLLTSNIFHTFQSFIVDFEQVNVCWVHVLVTSRLKDSPLLLCEGSYWLLQTSTRTKLCR